MRLLAIGDIHGYLTALDALLACVDLKAEDQVIFLGDYVDKGSDVKGVVDRLLQVAQKHDAIFLRGNHDQMLVDAYRDPSKVAIWECLAGENAMASYGEGALREVIGMVPLDHIRFLEDSCRDYFETPDYIFVHGGIRPHMDLAEEDQERLLWTTLSMAEAHHSGRMVICGHSSQRTGRIADLGHTLCLDTGITGNGWLSCVDLESFGFWQVTVEGECRTGRLRAR